MYSWLPPTPSRPKRHLHEHQLLQKGIINRTWHFITISAFYNSFTTMKSLGSSRCYCMTLFTRSHCSDKCSSLAEFKNGTRTCEVISLVEVTTELAPDCSHSGGKSVLKLSENNKKIPQRNSHCPLDFTAKAISKYEIQLWNFKEKILSAPSVF